MFAIIFFIITLVIAPQLWLPPFIGLPTDYIAYPLLALSVLLSGRLRVLLTMTAHDRLLLAFVLWMTLSGLVNGLGDLTLPYLIFYFKVFVLFKLVSALIVNHEQARRLVRYILALVLLLCAEVFSHRFSADGRGWAGQTFSWIDPDVLAAGGKGRARWVGIFDGPGVFAVLFTMVLPFSLMWIHKSYSLIRRLLGCLVTAILLIVSYFVGSRGGMVANAAVIALFIAYRFGVRFKVIALSAVVGGVALMLAPSYLTTIRDQSNSTQYRVEVWAEGLNMMKGDPLFGIGRGNFREYTGRLIAHNSAIEIGGETGLVGLFLWFALVYMCAKSPLLAAGNAKVQLDRDFNVAVALAVAGYLVSSMFVTLEYETFYVLMALCAAIGRVQGTATEIGWKTFRTVGLMVVGFVVIVQLFVIVYLG